MVDYIILAVVILIIAVAGFYVYKSKKNGKKCIGCPYQGCGCQKGSCTVHNDNDTNV